MDSLASSTCPASPHFPPHFLPSFPPTACRASLRLAHRSVRPSRMVVRHLCVRCHLHDVFAFFRLRPAHCSSTLRRHGPSRLARSRPRQVLATIGRPRTAEIQPACASSSCSTSFPRLSRTLPSLESHDNISMPHPQPTGVIFIPRDREVPLTQLVAGFEGIYNALCDRAAHFADRRDGESAARIGRLLFRLQAWIGSWWNDHLFRVELRIKRDEPPFADNPARLNNFATWWLFTSPQQREVVNYLTRLGQKIREGRFDNKAQLPSFDDIAVKLELYTPKERPASNSYGLSPRLSRASVQKAESWVERSRARLLPNYSQSQQIFRCAPTSLSEPVVLLSFFSLT
ncbi:hypothetical protein BJY59DRAFT_168020 [Rhodotorula toruloides]